MSKFEIAKEEFKEISSNISNAITTPTNLTTVRKKAMYFFVNKLI